jgi:hypothetical protein
MEDIGVLIQQLNRRTICVLLFTQDICEVRGLLSQQARVHIEHDLLGPNVKGCNAIRKGAV